MEKITSMSSMTERGQITIPKEIRDKEKLKPEDKFFIYDADGTLIVIKASTDIFSEFLKTMREVGKYVTYEDIRKLRAEERKLEGKRRLK